jgi:hypothetical protein
VEDGQIGLLAGGGEIQLFCKACRNITFWRYPRPNRQRNSRPLTTDPLLETFEQCEFNPPENFRPDPLLIDYQSILSGKDTGLRNWRISWDWYG